MSSKWLLVLSAATILISRAAAQEQLLREAARLDDEHRCEEAEGYYRQAIAKGSPSIPVLNNFGNHFVTCGQPEQARRWFERVLQLNPGHANANLQLARLEVDQKHGAKALAHLKVLDASDAQVQLLRAEALQLSGQRAAASAILDAVDQRANGDPRMLFALGLACARLERYDQAESAFNHILLVYPQDFDVLVNLGRAAARAGHHDRAERALESALRIQPRDPDALTELGLSHAARQDYPRAVFLLAQASERAPQRPDILRALARAAEGAGYYGDAMLAYDRYLTLRPLDETAVRDRALIWGLSETRLSDGLIALESYVGKHPGDATGHLDLAQLLWRSNSDRSLKELTDAVRSDGNLASARLARAWLLYRMGKAAESLPDLRAADHAKPHDPRILTQMGLAYLAMDLHADAETVLRQAVSLAPDDPETLLALGRCLMAMDRVEEAQVILDRFQKLRPQAARGPRKEAGLIEMASMPEAKRIQRDIQRLRRDAASHPGDPELQLNLASLLLANGDTVEALREFRALPLGRNDQRILRKAGAALMAAREYVAASDLLKRAVTEDEEARVELAWAVFCTDGLEAGSRVLESVPEDARSAGYFLVYARMMDAAGRKDDAARALQQGLRLHPSEPDFAREASLLLLRQEKGRDAIELLQGALKKTPADPDLLLRIALARGVTGDVSTAEKGMREIETRWPEWERPYLLHGVLLERTRPDEARQKFQTALALGLGGEIGRCAKARVEVPKVVDLKCSCLAGVLDWFAEMCSGVR